MASIKILYVDDETELCEIFSDMLSEQGVSITTESDPKKVFELVEQEKFGNCSGPPAGSPLCLAAGAAS